MNLAQSISPFLGDLGKATLSLKSPGSALHRTLPELGSFCSELGIVGPCQLPYPFLYSHISLV